VTTGHTTVGAPNQDVYIDKTWSGSDGLSTENNYDMTMITHIHTKSKIIGSPSAPQYYANCSATIPLAFDANAQLRLINKLAQEVKGHQFNLAVAAGEGRKTLDLMSSTITSMVKSVKALKRGDAGNALRHLGLVSTGNTRGKALDTGDIAKTWLSIQYGWKPLINDVYESARAFEKLTSGPRKHTYRTSTSVSTKGDASSSPSNWTCGGARRISRRLKLVMVEELSAPRSLGLLDPLSLAWELTPFSFVADWFVPIGTYFEALNVAPILNGLPVVESTFDVQNSAVSTILNTAVYDPNGFRSQYNKVTVRRAIVPFSVPLPRFNDASKIYNSGRAANALALARVVFF
jgi:hypothetical protein